MAAAAAPPDLSYRALYQAELASSCGGNEAVQSDGITIEFDVPATWPCCNYTCVRCNMCQHIHNDRERVIRIKSKMLRGVLTLSVMTEDAAASRGVSVIYAVCINGVHVMDLAAISCSHSSMKFSISRSHKSSGKSDPDTIVLKVGSINSRVQGRENVYRRSPVLILAAEKDKDWTAYRTAVICAKTSNVNCDGVYVRHARLPGAAAKAAPDARTSLASDFAEAHQACVAIYAATSLQQQVAILETIYWMRASRAENRADSKLVSRIRKVSAQPDIVHEAATAYASVAHADDDEGVFELFG